MESMRRRRGMGELRLSFGVMDIALEADVA
jgi:hypothetical protein